MIGYKQLRGKIKTGDIALFSGNGPTAVFLKLAMKSKWTHVGMFWHMKEYDMLCIFESTMQPSIDNVDTGEPRKGVQIVSASNRVAQYNGEVCVRRLINTTMTGYLDELKELRHKLNGLPYEQDMVELAKAAIDGPGPIGLNTEDLTSLFCSELVAECYQTANLLPDSKPSNEYEPHNFADDIKLLRGHLGEIEVLKEG